MILKLLLSRHWRGRKRHYFAKQLSYSVQGRLLRLFVILLLIVVTHTIAISYFEKMSLWSGLWLTLTTMTTVGYGDISAHSIAGQLTTIVLIYIFGIWLLAQLAGEYIDFRFDRREKMVKGQWRWKNMQNHIVIINSPVQDRDRYLTRLVEQIRNTPEFATIPVQILTDAYTGGLPTGLQDMAVVHYCGSIDEAGSLTAVNAQFAKCILILAEDAYNTRSDCVTLDTLDRLRHIDHHAYVLAECVQDENKPRFIDAQANAVMRPIRAYPEILVRALAAPGVEQILENLFRHHGDTTCRYDITLKNRKWKDIACKLMNSDIGTPLGYVDQTGIVITNPPANETISSKAIIVLVRAEAIPEEADIRLALATVAECI